MNDSFDFERYVAHQFANVVRPSSPASSVDHILTEASRTRPLPRWLATIKEPPMRFHSNVVVGSPTLRRSAALAVATALLLASAGAVVAGASLLPSPEVVASVRNGLIAFDSDGDIWVTDAEDTDRIQLTSGPSWDSSPTWSPQGDRIAYWTQRTPTTPFVLMLMDAGGANSITVRSLVQERLNVTDGLPPVWRPDGTQLAYSVNDGSTQWIESVDVATQQHRRLANGRNPSWSPDGTMLVYQGGSDQGEVWTMTADGTSAQQLTLGDGAVWSSNDRIAYYHGQPGGANDIWVMDADGTDAINITESSDDEYWPVWSPDGSRLAFDRATSVFSNNDIVVASPDGSDPVTLPRAPVTAKLVWSPDGAFIASVLFNEQDGEHGLQVTDTSGAAPGRSIQAAGHTGYDSWQALAP